MQLFTWCRREPSDDEANRSLGARTPPVELEAKGITLATKVPKLTDAQRQARDAALAKYRRRLAREERRRRKEAVRAARAEARLARMRAHLQSLPTDGLDLHEGAHEGWQDDLDSASVRTSSTAITNTTLTTATTTVASSRAVYGRGAYVHPHSTGDDTDEDEDSLSDTATTSSRTRSCGSRSHSLGSRRGSRPLPDLTRAALRHRRRRQRRRHPSGDAARDAVDLLNPWVDLSTTAGSSHRSDGGRDEHARMTGGSFASSAPRPPEEVLATAGLTVGTGDRRRECPGGAVPTLASDEPAAGLRTTRADAGNGGGGEEGEEEAVFADAGAVTGRSSRARTPERSPPRDCAGHQSGRPQWHVDPARRDSGGGDGGDGVDGAARREAVAAPPGAAVRRRRWTGKDVEMNVALSGFFTAAGGMPFTSPGLASSEGRSVPALGDTARRASSEAAERRRNSASSTSSSTSSSSRGGRHSPTARSGNISRSPAGYEDRDEVVG